MASSNFLTGQGLCCAHICPCLTALGQYECVGIGQHKHAVKAQSRAAQKCCFGHYMGLTEATVVPPASQLRGRTAGSMQTQPTRLGWACKDSPAHPGGAQHSAAACQEATERVSSHLTVPACVQPASQTPTGCSQSLTAGVQHPCATLPLVQVVSLFPLFPGTNEMDQIEKIHAIMGTPPPEVLARMKKHSTHIEYDFNPKVGSGHVTMARRHRAALYPPIQYSCGPPI